MPLSEELFFQHFKIEHHDGLYFFKIKPYRPLTVSWDKWCGTRKVICYYKKVVEVTYKKCVIIHLKFKVSQSPFHTGFSIHHGSLSIRAWHFRYFLNFH